MVEKIRQTKDKVLVFMDTEIGKYGGSRMDVKEIGELADIVKDLAAAEESCWEAQYYRTVTEAMESGGDSRGYGGGMGAGNAGYGGMAGGRRGYGDGNRMMGHSDPVAAIRDMMATGSPEMKMQIRNELSGML